MNKSLGQQLIDSGAVTVISGTPKELGLGGLFSVKFSEVGGEKCIERCEVCNVKIANHRSGWKSEDYEAEGICRSCAKMNESLR